MPAGGLPAWDDEVATSLPGKLILVGITYKDAEGAVVESVQFFGRVVKAERARGITLALEGGRSGETYVLPPDMRSLERARPGEYRLRSTGEIVIDPDFLITWIGDRPSKH